MLCYKIAMDFQNLNGRSQKLDLMLLESYFKNLDNGTTHPLGGAVLGGAKFYIRSMLEMSSFGLSQIFRYNLFTLKISSRLKKLLLLF